MVNDEDIRKAFSTMLYNLHMMIYHLQSFQLLIEPLPPKLILQCWILTLHTCWSSNILATLQSFKNFTYLTIKNGNFIKARLAQSAERGANNATVAGSIPASSKKFSDPKNESLSIETLDISRYYRTEKVFPNLISIWNGSYQHQTNNTNGFNAINLMSTKRSYQMEYGTSGISKRDKRHKDCG
ncbi:hypothetical protein ACTA71_006906 [Dictyostelium dimigraforme]